jgi:hypothetical protein
LLLFYVNVTYFNKVIGILVVVSEAIVLKVLFLGDVVEFVGFTKLTGYCVLPKFVKSTVYFSAPFVSPELLEKIFVLYV